MMTAAEIEGGTLIAPLLWVDDRIQLLQGHIRRLEAGGIEVVAAASVAEGAELIRSDRAFGGIMLDIRMSNGESGLSLLPDIAHYQRDAQPIVFSSFLHIGQERTRLEDAQKKTEVTIFQLEKGQLPHLRDPHFDAFFTDKIRQVLRERASANQQATHARRPAKRRRNLVQAHTVSENPYAVSFDKFIELPTLEKCRLIAAARKMVDDKLQSLFDKGCIWVLFCGDTNNPAAVAYRHENVLQEEEILVLGRERNRAPFHFAADVEVDDISSEVCSSVSETRGYPVVNIDLNGAEILVHFDTGSANSYFSCEFLVEEGLISTPAAPGSMRVNRGEIYYKPYEVQGLVKDQFNGTTQIVSLSAHAVLDWVDGPFRRVCRRDCGHFQTSRVDGICIFRKGLLGRDLIRNNKLRIVISGSSGKTGFGKENGS